MKLYILFWRGASKTSFTTSTEGNYCVTLELRWLQLQITWYQISHFRSWWLSVIFKCYSSKECGVSRRYSEQTAIVLLKTCPKDVLPHLRGCYKTTAEGVDFEWRLDLPLQSRTLPRRRRLSNYLSLTDRDEFGWGWGLSKACKYPLHDSKQKPTRGVTRLLSDEICQKWNVLGQIGQG